MKFPAGEFRTWITRLTRSVVVLAHPSAIDLSRSHLRFLTRQLAERRRQVGTRLRRLPPNRQALLVLARLRRGDTCTRLAASFDIGVATVYRCIRQAVDLLAALVPTLQQTLKRAAAKAVVILDGTLLPIDRIAADRPFSSGEHRRHGMNVQALTDPSGRLLRASAALPGAVHGIRAARTHGIIDASAEVGLACCGDKDYQGADGTLRVPFRGGHRNLSVGRQAADVAHARIRAVGEQAMATLKSRRLLRELRCSTTRITGPVQAPLTLHIAWA